MKKCVSLFLTMLLVLSLAACGSEASAPAASDDSKTQESADTGKDTSEEDLSAIVVDTEAKTIKIKAQVNGKYFEEPTHHFVVNKDGGNGEKCVLKAWCTAQDFYGAMLQLGAEPADNMNNPAETGEVTEGVPVDVTVSWDGSNGEVPMKDCLIRQDGSPFACDIRFGGNIKNSYQYMTGCITCTFSCFVGITSNAAYGYGTEDVLGNAEVLPEDGTIVTVTYTLLG